MISSGQTNQFTKSGTAVCAFHPVKTKKNHHTVLRNRVLEIYKSFKDEKSGKEPKERFDLSLVFSIQLHYDPSLKECISLMMPNETFLVRYEIDLVDWFTLLIDEARQARATKLCRPVFREEYFEAAWDVEAIKVPKLKNKAKNGEQMEDLVAKYEKTILGKRRLCIDSHSIYIFKKGVTAISDGVPPFQSDEFMEFPISAVSVYGHQEKYFFFRAGRCSPTGAGELWFNADSGECASAISEKIIKICERESEKKQKQKIHSTTISSRTLRKHSHRERLRAHQNNPNADSSSNEVTYRKSSSKKAVDIAVPSALKLFNRSFSEIIGSSNMRFTKSSNSMIGKSHANSLDHQQNSINVHQSLVNQSAECSSVAAKIGPAADSKTDPEIKAVENWVCAKNPSADAMRNDISTRHFDVKFTFEADDDPPIDDCCHNDSTDHQTSLSPSDQVGDYLHMECSNMDQDHSLSNSKHRYTLSEVYSYFPSDVEEKRTTREHIKNHSTPMKSASDHLMSQKIVESDRNANKIIEDPRSRAHSVGSKTWLKPLRKLSSSRCSEQSSNTSPRQRSDSLDTSGKKRDHCDLLRAVLHHGDNQKDDLTEWNFGVSPIHRSGSSSIASNEGLNLSHTGSFSISSSLCFRTTFEELLKSQADKSGDASLISNSNIEELFMELPEDDNEYVLSTCGNTEIPRSIQHNAIIDYLTSNQRVIGTILEQNVSSGSSRSQSPKFAENSIENRFVAKESVEHNAANEKNCSNKIKTASLGDQNFNLSEFGLDYAVINGSGCKQEDVRNSEVSNSVTEAADAGVNESRLNYTVLDIS